MWQRFCKHPHKKTIALHTTTLPVLNRQRHFSTSSVWDSWIVCACGAELAQLQCIKQRCSVPSSRLQESIKSSFCQQFSYFVSVTWQWLYTLPLPCKQLWRQQCHTKLKTTPGQDWLSAKVQDPCLPAESPHGPPVHRHLTPKTCWLNSSPHLHPEAFGHLISQSPSPLPPSKS